MLGTGVAVLSTVVLRRPQRNSRRLAIPLDHLRGVFVGQTGERGWSSGIVASHLADSGTKSLGLDFEHRIVGRRYQLNQLVRLEAVARVPLLEPIGEQLSPQETDGRKRVAQQEWWRGRKLT